MALYIDDVVTPTDLRKLREYLGVTIPKAANLFGVSPALVEELERGRKRFVISSWVAKLSEIAFEADCFADELARQGRLQGYHVIFRSDDDFRDHRPELASRLIFAGVHSATLARLKFEHGHLMMTFVDFSASSYADWAAQLRGDKSMEEWAADRAKRYSTRDVIPVSAQ